MVLVVGANGAGKTNLLEGLHVGVQGFSPRTRADGELVRAGAETGRVSVAGTRGSTAIAIEVMVRASGGKEVHLNGARLAAAERLRSEVAALVFTPDRLAVVKAGPAVRRAYLDRVVGRLFPAWASLPSEYVAALGQRNAALRRLAVGLSTPAAIEPWTERVATLGAELSAARREAVRLLAPVFAERAGELGLEEATIVYEGRPPTAAELTARLERDLERGATGAGPHLDEVRLLAGARDLRSFGSQGEQRIAVLALLLAEAELVVRRRGATALLLLDDVLSELDGDRRRCLAEAIGRGQTVITATSPEAFPGEPSQVVRVTPGRAEEL